MQGEFGFSKIVESVEKYSPFVARKMLMQFLNNASPFNGHLKGSLVAWSKTKCKVVVKLRRSVKNHLGGVHAGALFTLGETCAGLILIKNFSPQNFRLILKSASVEYNKQARGNCSGQCEIDQEKLKELQKNIESHEPFFIPMETIIKNSNDELLCTVKTEWQIKPWDQVKKST